MKGSDKTTIKDLGITCGSYSFKVLENGNKKSIIWTETNGLKSEAIATFYDEKLDTWSKEIKLTNYDKKIKSLSPVLKQDGDISMALNIADVKDKVENDESPYGKTDLVIADTSYNNDLIVNKVVSYNEKEVKPSKNIKLTAQVKNNSTKDINELNIEIKKENGELIKRENISCFIKPGEYSNIEFNTASVEIGHSDLVFKEYSIDKSESGTKVKTIIRNNGFDIATNIKVSLFKDGSYGTNLGNKSIRDLKVNEEELVEFIIPAQYDTFTSELNSNLYNLEITSDSLESDLANNGVDLYSSAIRVKSLSLDKDQLSINKNNKKSLIPTILPTNAGNSKIIWLTSNSDIAVVDANGIIAAKEPGEVIISATTVDGNITSKCVVKVYKEYDFNYDGKVTKLDVNEAVKHYNSLKGDSNYLEEMDVNKDGIIDIIDISMVSSNVEE